MKFRYAEDFEEETEGDNNESNPEDESFEYEDDEDNALMPQKQAWLYEQAIRGQARQRAASQLQAVLRRLILISYKYLILSKILHI